jgi:ketosteroid isomerase-like protein
MRETRRILSAENAGCRRHAGAVQRAEALADPRGASHGPLSGHLPTPGRAGLRSAESSLTAEAGLLRRSVVSGWDAASRRDFELMLVFYAPDVELETDPEFEALGISGTFRGHDGMLTMIQAFDEAWERREFQPELMLDLGDRVLLLSNVRLPGNVSGLELESEFAQLITPRGGLVAHQHDFLAWNRGLRAAGLDPDAIALPSRSKTGQVASSAG